MEDRSQDLEVEKKFKPIHKGKEFLGIKLKE
jgi:hypothetical protein